MRLINVENGQFEWYVNAEDVNYAILSHVWGDEEISFQDYNEKNFNTANGDLKMGYRKIQYTLMQARNDKISFIWIDTCCIDKTSSAELSEAINSMFNWYKRSHLCYVYLGDVFSIKGIKKEGAMFRKAKWFTRGWTLQELIAPYNVWFFSFDWTNLGSKISLAPACSKATGIPEYLLLNPDTLRSYSIAQRMSWASKRKTTRPEDVAYCLLGLFDVNIPTLYGEGQQKAFHRLQEELIKRSDDDSIFAFSEAEWRCVSLASSPASFAACGDIVVVDTHWAEEPHTVTNKGLRMRLRILPDTCPECKTWERAVLRCRRQGDFNSFLGFYLSTASVTGERRRISAILNTIPIGDALQHEVQAVLILGTCSSFEESDYAASAVLRPCLLTFARLSRLGYEVRVPIHIANQKLSNFEGNIFQMRKRQLDVDLMAEPGLVFFCYLPYGMGTFCVALIHYSGRDTEVVMFPKPSGLSLQDLINAERDNES